jgi:predicted glycosyltransferase
MKYLFYFGHPAHFHLFKNVITRLKINGHTNYILIKKKDVLENLVKKSGNQYVNILPRGRKDNTFAIASGLLIRDARVFAFCLKNRPDIMIGTSAEITHIGRLLKIPSINVNEDDVDAVSLFAKLGYPWADTILVPECCRTGKWHHKTVNYRGYHELAYLHPKCFVPNKEIISSAMDVKRPYFVIRFAKLTAYHDKGKTGITGNVAQKLIKLIKPNGNIYITSERRLEPEFEKYRITIDPSDIHHALYYAKMFIGDSQTMTAESAVLGTPAIRFNDFVGKLGYLEELELQHGLTYGINASEPDKLYQKIDELLNICNLKEEWERRRQKMLRQKIDVAEFLVWFLENYPTSRHIMKTNPDYQNNFI